MTKGISKGYVENEDELYKYLDRLIKDAEKHGVKIMSMTAKVPMLDVRTIAVTEHGRDDYTCLLESLRDLNKEAIRQLRKDAARELKKLDEF